MSIFPLTTTSCRTTDREAEAQAIVDEHSVAALRLTVQSSPGGRGQIPAASMCLRLSSYFSLVAFVG
jgi:hypothetical protein